MANPELDDLLDQLEDAFEAGNPLTVDQVCAGYPELLEPLREKWDKLRKFDDRFCTRRETADEVQRKLAAMPEHCCGTRLVVQTEVFIKSVHAEGGFGIVYDSDDQELSRKLAIKMPKVACRDAELDDDFKREIEIIGRLNHPGVVSILGKGETFDGRPFYAMPFMNCGNLQDSSSTYHEQSPDRVHASNAAFRDLIYRLANVCKTIAYAHSRGVVHLDLKPQNVMLGKYGETVVIDWGCATRIKCDPKFKVHAEPTVQLTNGNDSQPSNFLTLRYASPEQLGERDIDHASDIYSLGAMLYKLLTGQAPHENLPHSNVAKEVLAGKIDRPQAVKLGIPTPLQGICVKAMSLRPQDRYTNAMKMAEDLERYLADEPVSACREPTTSLVGRLLRKNKFAAVLLLGTFFIASMLLAGAYARQSLLASKAAESAEERLQIAATMAARIGELEIEKRMSLLGRQAQMPELAAALVAMELRPDDTSPQDKAQSILARLDREVRDSQIEIESMFINDASGKQIARVPWSKSVGKNFSYRHYFHGVLENQTSDQDASQTKPLPPAAGPVFSTVYRSTNVDKETGKYNPIKTAFSVPLTVRDASGDSRVVGRLGMSIKVNQLNVFRELAGISVNAHLVEMRQYNWENGTAQGVIIDGHQADDLAKREASDSDATKNANEIMQLSKVSVDQLRELMDVSDRTAGVLSDFYDPVIGSTQQSTACVFVKNPVSDDATQVWAMLFTEAESQP